MSEQNNQDQSNPIPLWEVLLHEHLELRASKSKNGSNFESNFESEKANVLKQADPLAEVYRRIHADVPSLKPKVEIGGRHALCLSGGGIRSATFNLGLIQGLAKKGKLQTFDYLSTVSGGGFIGSWLSAWAHRLPGGIAEVEKLLSSSPKNRNCPIDRVEPQEVTHLRDYSNYLTPKASFISLDAWTLIATYPRNLLLIWLVLLPLLAAAITGMWALVNVALYLNSLWQNMSPEHMTTLFESLRWTGLLMFVLPIGVAVALAPSSPSPHRDEGKKEYAARKWLPRLLITFPSCIGALLLTLITPTLSQQFKQNQSHLDSIVFNLAIAGCALAVLAVAVRRLRANVDVRGTRIIGKFFQFWLLLSAALVFPIQFLTSILQHFDGVNVLFTLWLTFPLRLAVVFVVLTVIVGFTSEKQSSAMENVREWWARVMGALLRCGVLYVLAFAVFVIAPYFIGNRLSASQQRYSGSVLGLITGISALCTLVMGYWGKVQTLADFTPRVRDRFIRAIPAATAIVFCISALIGLATVTDYISSQLSLHYNYNFSPLSLILAGGKFASPPVNELARSIGLPGALLLFAIGVAWPINVNRFSLHGTYRNRLIRAYLGASRGKERSPDPFTGFDADDNVPMHFLKRASRLCLNDVVDWKQAARLVMKTGDDALWDQARRASKTLKDVANASAISQFAASRTSVTEDEATENKRRLILKVLNEIIAGPSLYASCKDTAIREDPHIEAAHEYAEKTGDSASLCNRLILERAMHSNGRSLLRSDIARPFHVINATLNIVAGERLAWQQRKAKSFVMTPLFCGFDAGSKAGFRRTEEFSKGISLGGAMTISGAAASPNMGYHSSPAVTFLMALFNVRLGCWLGNPAYKKASRIFGASLTDDTYKLVSPRLSFRSYLDELFGLTTETHPYIYLSDAGHFDNTGLYEMIRRRCHFILLSDVSADPDRKFSDFGSAVQKIRIDMGVKIQMRNKKFLRCDERNVRYAASIAVCDVLYSEIDPDGKDGVLIYIKPAIPLNEPADVYKYSQESNAFPHESTVDQWFSETQFEAYRQLGELVVDNINWTGDPEPADSSEPAAGRLTGDSVPVATAADTV